MPFFRRLIIFLLAFAGNILAEPLHSENSFALEWNKSLANSYVEAGYGFGKFIGIKDNYAQLGLFLPIGVRQNYFAFADVKGYRFDKNYWGSSTGLGFRQWNQNQQIWGGNVYYDEISKSRSYFQRLGLGLEWLTSSINFRINGYMPLGRTKKLVGTQLYSNYNGNYQALGKFYQLATSAGIDAELEALLAYWYDFNLYGALGSYHYFKSHIRSITGGFGRFSFEWRRLISLQMRISYDRVYNARIQGLIALQLPFEIFSNWPPLDDLYHLFFTQPVRRQGVIFTQDCCRYECNW